MTQTLTVIEAPARTSAIGPGLFLAGGISHCRNWQAEAIDLLGDFAGVIYNPRRAHWPEHESEIEKQIQWERHYLTAADLCLFWFPPETDCPITLFELGHTLGAQRPVVVGCDPAYRRRIDVRIQTRLSEPKLTIASSLAELCDQVRTHSAIAG